MALTRAQNAMKHKYGKLSTRRLRSVARRLPDDPRREEFTAYGVDGVARRDEAKRWVKRVQAGWLLGWFSLGASCIVFYNPWEGGWSWWRGTVMFLLVGVWNTARQLHVGRVEKIANAELLLAGLGDMDEQWYAK